MKPVERKVAYITGGSMGIGFGIARALLQQGYRVAISGRNKDRISSASKLLGTEDVLGLVSDVANDADERDAVLEILNVWGRLDVVIANAGVGHFAPVDKLTSGQWQEMINTNLTGAFNTLQASMQALKDAKGYFITIASLAGANFFASGAGYNASKFGLVGFTQAAMLDLRPYDIKVTTIMPGSVASHFNNHIPTAADAWKIQPEDIGELVVDLLNMNPRTLPSKIEVRPTRPDLK